MANLAGELIRRSLNETGKSRFGSSELDSDKLRITGVKPIWRNPRRVMNALPRLHALAVHLTRLVPLISFDAFTATANASAASGHDRRWAAHAPHSAALRIASSIAISS